MKLHGACPHYYMQLKCCMLLVLYLGEIFHQNYPAMMRVCAVDIVGNFKCSLSVAVWC